VDPGLCPLHWTIHLWSHFPESYTSWGNISLAPKLLGIPSWLGVCLGSFYM
jgi:hypothetical protein